MASKDRTSDEPNALSSTAYTGKIFAADVFTSSVIGLSIAAPVTIIDYSIMMKVSGVSPSITHGLKEGFTTLLTRPHHFFLRCPHNQYALIYRVVATVYGLTYLSSNVAKDAMEARGGYSGSEVNWARGIASGVVNTVLTVFKDSFILRNLPMASGGVPAPKYVPVVSRVGFCVRDVVTCVAAFTLVPMFAQWLAETYRGDALPFASNKTVSALSVPALMQFLTTAMHIAAIRYQRTYPHPSWADVSASMRKDYVGSVAARMGRIIPAFGIGSLGNTALLDTTTRWAHELDGKQKKRVV